MLEAGAISLMRPRLQHRQDWGQLSGEKLALLGARCVVKQENGIMVIGRAWSKAAKAHLPLTIPVRPIFEQLTDALHF
jgi:hypothetical protein